MSSTDQEKTEKEKTEKEKKGFMEQAGEFLSSAKGQISNKINKLKSNSPNPPNELPGQKQEKHPGEEYKMDPPPQYDAPWYYGSEKLKDKVALITGGDSGIGRSISILFAREGAKLAIVYLNEDKDAQDTEELVKKEGGEILLIKCDIQTKENCKNIIDQVINKYGKLDILINHAGYQAVCSDIRDITPEQLDKTFRTNIYSMFYLTQYALNHMKEGSCIINTSSVVAFKGKETLIDYAASNGAVQAFTRSLAINLAEKKIRVNAVAPGPIWTPFIPSSFGKDLGKKAVKEFGKNTLLQRPGQPEEVSPSYVFLASNDSSYFTGQTLHPNGGEIVNA